MSERAVGAGAVGSKALDGEAGGGALLIGAGGLGSAVALALLACDLPRIGLADEDHVALSNLQRQILYRMPDLARPKVEAAREALTARASTAQVVVMNERLMSAAGIAQAARGFGVIIDGSDNFETRFAANDAAFLSGVPLVHGAVAGLRGQVMTICPGVSPCLRCLFAEPPLDGATCQREGILGAVAGEIGWLMAMEAVKLLTGAGKPLTGRLLTVDALSGRRRMVPLARNPRCGAPGCFSNKGEQGE